ncbi:MAG: glycoside hydrolase family 32 protein [Planctomycetaceae bacterium]
MRALILRLSQLVMSLLTAGISTAFAADDVLIEDFESGTYEHWKLTGTAFGDAPAAGTLPNQMTVSGFRGARLVNTYAGGDYSVGTATSKTFTIERSHIAFLIGGGPHANEVGIELLIGDESVRSSTGSESEELEWKSWNVSDLTGQQARIRIFDRATGGWGHINVDQIVQTDTVPGRFDLEHQLAAYRTSADYMNEPLRPQFHFSPEINWMNDPNGLVWHDGEYHLFYQYNPAGNSWGHMSWGHAVSSDLMRWKHLPLAIPETDGIMAFSGCCVVDHRNSSGFGEGDRPPMVAIYTGHGYGKQTQCLAYSNDNGRSWTIYQGNPVLDLNKADFRDPKVFWHAPTERWVMVVSLANEKILVFYTSNDLKNWTESSRFGPAGVTSKPNWECPDLFELPIEGTDGETLWVLEADMGSGSIAGGSGGEYFVGRFDGSRFTALQQSRWVDFGRDFYAPVSWSNIPESDGRRIWLGWFNNWETCLVPTSPWRSCMSIPRELSIRNVGLPEFPEYVLVQRPVQELDSLTTSIPIRPVTATWPPVELTSSGQLDDMRFRIQAELLPGKARSCGLRIRTGNDEFTEIGYDTKDQAVYVDRRKSGNVDFHPAFAGRHHAPARLLKDSVLIDVVVDRSTIEVFINDGEAVISDRIFPASLQPVIEVFAGDPSASVRCSSLQVINSVWKN